MLTITTEKQVIYININLLKSKLKKAVLKLLKALSIASGFCGAFWILETAGASDCEIITINQILPQITQSIVFFGISYILYFVKNALQ